MAYLSVHLDNLYGRPNHLHIVRIDFKTAAVRPAIHTGACKMGGAAHGRRLRRTTDVAAEHRALVTINGSRFLRPSLTPRYAQKAGGELIGSTLCGFGLAFSGNGKLFLGEVDLPSIGNWDNLLCGFPLVMDGKLGEGPGMDENGRPAPRTMLGFIPSEKVLLIVVVDGRRKTSRGMTPREGALFLRELGCTEAIDLDGGEASTLVIRTKALLGTVFDRNDGGPVTIMNTPSDGVEGKVLDHLMILDDRSVDSANR